MKAARMASVSSCRPGRGGRPGGLGKECLDVAGTKRGSLIDGRGLRRKLTRRSRMLCSSAPRIRRREALPPVCSTPVISATKRRGCQLELDLRGVGDIKRGQGRLGLAAGRNRVAGAGDAGFSMGPCRETTGGVWGTGESSATPQSALANAKSRSPSVTPLSRLLLGDRPVTFIQT
jgi:hypothetical protein